MKTHVGCIFNTTSLLHPTHQHHKQWMTPEETRSNKEGKLDYSGGWESQGQPNTTQGYEAQGGIH